MKNRFAIAILTILVGFALPAAADTLTLTSVSGAVVNGVYVYPYNFTANINGTSSSMSLMCMDYNREITVGETWKINEGLIPMDSSQLSVDYRALALLFWAASTNYGGVSAADYQFAAWSIFDPTDMANNSGMDPMAQYAASLAVQTAVGGALPSGFSYSNFALYMPTSDTTGWTAGTPQRFIGYMSPNISVSPTPEPSSLLLLGTGILGGAGLMMRRRKMVLA